MVEQQDDITASCSDCGEFFTVNSKHDCPGTVYDRLNFLEGKVKELKDIIAAIKRIAVYAIKDVPIGRSHHSEPPPPPKK